MSSFDLQLYQSYAGEVFRNKFQRMLKFGEHGDIFGILKGTNEPLPYRMIRNIKSKEDWDFDLFWMISGFWLCWKHRKHKVGLFMNISKKEKSTIAALYNIFKNIAVVSIFLRFVDRDNFGIISPTVSCALGMKAKEDYTDEYVDYLLILRDYFREHDFSKIADVDIALWTLVGKCLADKHSDYENLRNY